MERALPIEDAAFLIITAAYKRGHGIYYQKTGVTFSAFALGAGNSISCLLIC